MWGASWLSRKACRRATFEPDLDRKLVGKVKMQAISGRGSSTEALEMIAQKYCEEESIIFLHMLSLILFSS